MNLLITEFSGGMMVEPSWERAYVEACRRAEAERDVHVVDVRDVPEGFEARVVLAVHAVTAQQVLTGVARPPLAEAHVRQANDPVLALGVSACGGQASEAVEQVLAWFAWVPAGASRWVVGVADAGCLRDAILAWLLVIADRRFGGRFSEESLFGHVAEVVRDELPGAATATNARRPRLFRGTPG